MLNVEHPQVGKIIKKTKIAKYGSLCTINVTVSSIISDYNKLHT